MADTCTHLDEIDHDATPSSPGCEDCLRLGGRWVHLRMCRACGHVGCCDSSPAKHATAHNRESGHALVSSYEPGELWWWCYPDQLGFELPDEPKYAHP
jgi:Zn-finger in ubiquitin-hydrolases and other protein